MTQFFNPTPFHFTPIDSPAAWGRNTLTFAVKATFDLVAGAMATPAKDQLPFAGDTPHMDQIGRSLAWPDDLVPWKPHTDFFIVGAFHQPGGVPAPEGQAAFRFGPLAKRLRIHGPRMASRLPGTTEWSITAPEPVASVPLRWEFSLGGLRDRRNPYGLGRDPQMIDGLEVLRLPLIESASAPDMPDNFCPVPSMFDERRRKLGTRDQRWSLFRAPMPPEDFDPSCVNAAPSDQQAGDSPRGDETITLINLHAAMPQLTVLLPGIRMRVAVLRRTPDAVLAEEVPMRLDTIGVLPDAGKLVLLWRGVVDISARNYNDEILMAECAAVPAMDPGTEPDLPRQLFDRWKAAEAAEEKKEAVVAANAQAEIMKLLPKANLPPGLAAMIEKGGDPAEVFTALEKHISDALAALQARLPKP